MPMSDKMRGELASLEIELGTATANALAISHGLAISPARSRFTGMAETLSSLRHVVHAYNATVQNDPAQTAFQFPSASVPGTIGCGGSDT